MSEGLLLGIIAGGAWNLINLWCLARMLHAWLGPRRSQRQAMMWLLVKFPLLYTAVFLLLRHPVVSVIGFGLGFTAVLAAAVIRLALDAQRVPMARSHGR
jgi:hypothetical protein